MAALTRRLVSLIANRLLTNGTERDRFARTRGSGWEGGWGLGSSGSNLG
jgi:hypothetical protein